MKEYRNFNFKKKILFSDSNFGLILKARTWKKERLQNIFNLRFSNKDFKMQTQNINQVNRSLSLKRILFHCVFQKGKEAQSLFASV